MNFLNAEIGEGQDIEDLIENSANSIEVLSLKIAETKFVPITFHHLPIQLPIHVQAILDIDFFMEHLIFLDFTHNLAYFAHKNKTELKN